MSNPRVTIKVSNDRAVLRVASTKVADSELVDNKPPEWMIQAANEFKEDPPKALGEAKRRIRFIRKKT